MSRGKSEGGPLFPRLHVNDTDKGGPKPPPRNKMALYEQQLSVPSQRVKDAPTSIFYGAKLANTNSSTQGHGLEKSRYHLNVRQGSFSTDGVLPESNGISIKRLTTTTTAHTVELNTTETVFSSGMSTSFQLSEAAQLKWPSLLKNDESKLVKERNLDATSLRLQPDQESEGNLEVSNEGALKLYEPGLANQGKSENETPILKSIEDISPVISLKLITEEEHSERLSQVPTSSNTKQHSKLLVADNAKQPNISAVNNINAIQNKVRPSSDNVLNRNEDRTSNGLTRSSVARAFISPDDVVEMIGHKHFWNVRRAIINQQRVFSMQVFELHRIIKLQRIIAGSRHLLMDESLFLRDAISKPSSMKEATQNLVTENSSLLVKLRDNPFQKQPHTGIQTIVPKFGKSSFVSSTGSNFDGSNLDLKMMDSMDNKFPIWGLPQQVGNQWLVPVMSPSEGLIYKPYKEPPCPSQPGGYVPTFYGTFGESLSSSCGYNFPMGKSVGPTYFTPYGMPGMTQPVSTSAMNSGVISKNRNSEDALPLFPTVPSGCGSVQPMESTQSNAQKSQVIKVVPRNPRFASESAARIVELIQEERKHLCN
ncbi:ELF3-like protein 2 [Silene latifolia]|uniref:ELF3-like protein 2 n=1 Tax=Silene latifolia TaxID=37657 RepID=UPI003D77856D